MEPNKQKIKMSTAALLHDLHTCEERLRSTVQLSADTYWEHDEQCRVTLLMGPSVDGSDFDMQKFVGRYFWDLPGATSTAAEHQEYQALIDKQQPFYNLVVKATHAGVVHHYSNSGLPIFDGEGRFRGFRGISKDITAKLRAEQLLKLQHDITVTLAGADAIDSGIRSVLEIIGSAENWQCGAFWCVDEDEDVMFLQNYWMAPNAVAPGADCFSHLTDIKVQRGVGMTGQVWESGEMTWIRDITKRVRPRDAATLRSFGFRSALVFPLCSNGSVVGVFIFFSAEERRRDERLLAAVATACAQIEQFWRRRRAEQSLRENQDRIEYLATHDSVTSLPNRVMFNEMLAVALQYGQRYSRHFAVLFIDLDRFKIINDTFGHGAGDELLQEVSRRLIQTLRASDVVARFGGDEFAVLVQEVGQPHQVAAVARKILEALSRPMTICSQECRVTASIGISMYPADAQDAQVLMKNADIAMYRAKEEGKNTYQFFSENIKVQSRERLALENHLRRALERKELLLHYQAKLALRENRISGVEALLRWRHPELGLVSPAQFIPLAEETGLIVPIGKWVLQEACLQSMAWQRAGLPPVCMAVNLSSRQFASEELLGDIAAALQASNLQAELLELELTESMVMQNNERAVRIMDAIKAMGVRIAIDDFGVGYSSLAQIKRFPIDTLKVDRSFVRELPDNTEDRAITKAIIALAKTLSLTVVAEGVETPEQEQFLREHACDETQGFYFSRPIDAEQFAQLLRTHSTA